MLVSSKILVDLRKLKLLIGIQMEQLGRNTILHKFWPIFRIYAPAMIAYFTIGSILEVSSGKLPYKIFVCSGLIFWIIFTGVLVNSVRIGSNNERRRIYLSLTQKPTVFFLAYLLPYTIAAFLVSIPVIIYEFDQMGWKQGLLFFSKTISYLLLSMPISSFFIKVLSILTILIRDFRFVLPYFSQFFLLASPIFYLPRQPNTFFEIIWSKINILEMLITSYRESNIIYQTQLGFLFVFIFFVFLNSIMNRVMLRTYLSFSESSNLEEE